MIITKKGNKICLTDPLGERNEVNIQMRNAKSKFFHDKINDCSRSNDPKEAWTLINNLSELSVNDNLVSDRRNALEPTPK